MLKSTKDEVEKVIANIREQYQEDIDPWAIVDPKNTEDYVRYVGCLLDIIDKLLEEE